MRKIYLLLISISAFSVSSFAQPTVLGTQTVNGAYLTYDLNAIGLFKQYRVQASSSAATGIRSWEFLTGTAGVPDITTNWRPNTAAQTLSAYTTLIDPASAAASARYHTASGGSSGLMPAVTSGRYYTFNTGINNASDNYMSVLETSYNPVTISTVTATTPANASNSVLVTCNTSSAPNALEYVYVRYSSTITFTTSAISQFTFNSTTGQALIPCFAGGTTVYYYVMSSNKTSAQIATDAAVTQTAYDMATLNVNNNGGPNYTYVQGALINFGGIYSIPSPLCYTTVGAFVTALNAGAVTAPVTCYAIGGSATETATTGGIAITQTGTAANPIIFQKFGTGSYTIQSSATLTSGRLYDGIIKLIGADYITIDGFTLQENAANTTTAAGTNNMTEWGIALLHASVTDGAQHNTIQNNTISLNRTYQNTFGIYSNGRHTATAISVADNITNVSGSNFSNKVYANTISNVGYGIVFVGSSTAAYMDDGNEIGGSVVTGNSITNWGEGATAISGYISVTTSSFCIQANQQINDNISYNTITSATVSGGIFTFGGILKNFSAGAPSGTFSSLINYNTITLSSSNASGNMNGILSQGVTAASTATLTFDHNSIVNCVINGVGTSSAFGGIINSSAATTLNISNTTIRGLSSTSVSGGFTGISNSGAVVTAITITNNIIGDAVNGAMSFSVPFSGQINCITNTGAAATATLNIISNKVDGLSVVTSGQVAFIQNSVGSAATINLNNNFLGFTTGTLITFSGPQSSTIFGVYNGAGLATAAVSVSSNIIKGIVHSMTASCAEQLISNAVAVSSSDMSGNDFDNLSLNTTGQVILLSKGGSMVSGATSTCSSNFINVGFSKTASGSNVLFYLATATSATGSTVTVSGNSFSNVTVTGATNIIGLEDYDGVSSANAPTKIFSLNTFNNISYGTGYFLGIYTDAGTNSISSNNFNNISGSGDNQAFYFGANNGPGNLNIYSNIISSLSSTAGNVWGIQASSAIPPVTNIYSNSITGLSSAGNNAIINGIEITTGATVNIYDNLIYNLIGSGTTTPLANGINVSGGTTLNVYRNTIHTILQSGIISTSSPTINGILFSNGTTATVYNNFVSNLKATAASLGDAIRGISVTTGAASTTYNLYYNSVYINATSSGTNFGTTGIYHTSNSTATTAALNMINNIIVNTSTPNGTGITAAFRRPTSTLTNYGATSDYNNFYAGTASATRLIYSDGTNSNQTLAAYQAVVSTRDYNSISTLPTFTSTTDLHLTSANCQLDGRGTPITVTTDIDGATRDVTTPDIGADEFTATTSTSLAGLAGSAICETRTVSVTGTTYTSNACDLIARILPSGGSVVSGRVNTCVTLQASQQYFNAEPYVQRHYDIEPTTANATTTSATITLYFTNTEFFNFNTNNPSWPKLPTSVLGNADPNRANLKVTQYHGTATTSPSTPGNYTANSGSGTYIDPPDGNIVWNGSYWAVTFNVVGFSGFYVHTNIVFPLPVSLNYLNGVKQNGKHLLDWKVTCNSTPRVTMVLERSADARNFAPLYTISADALRCQQPFDYTDAQPLNGMNYYRLKIIDADGKITYSHTIALLNATKGFELLSIAPNPVTNGTFKLNATAAASTKLNIVISDMQGRIVNRQTISMIAGYNSTEMNVSTLAPGTYNISGMTDGNKSRVIRFVKQ